MKNKTKKRIFIFALVMCYCLGNMLVPIYAENNHDSSDDMSGFEDLLAERENTKTEDTAEDKPKVDISDFTDVKTTDWFYPYLSYLVENGLINGKTSTTFEPSSTFSYAECSAVIVRYLGLEDEAAQRQTAIVQRNPDMKNLWYAGYFETLSNLGIFNDYELFETEKGLIVSISRENANSPIVRYRFAESISMSFELDSDISAKNVYSEIGGRGREFIIGGAYNEDILAAYADEIMDYSDIPASSREYVQKAYYNGIFNGDVSGNFYPHNNLTRGEMAKVLATVSDYSLRTRLITEGYGKTVTENMLHTDYAGVKTLSYDIWTELLYDEAENLFVDGNMIEYISSAKAPFGYAIDVYLYEKNGDKYVLSNQCTLHDGNDQSFTSRTDRARVLFVVRNTKENCRTEGVLDVRIQDGQITEQKPLTREM